MRIRGGHRAREPLEISKICIDKVNEMATQLLMGEFLLVHKTVKKINNAFTSWSQQLDSRADERYMSCDKSSFKTKVTGLDRLRRKEPMERCR